MADDKPKRSLEELTAQVDELLAWKQHMESLHPMNVPMSAQRGSGVPDEGGRVDLNRPRAATDTRRHT